MIVITCPACSTRFRMDETHIPEKGVIVRCSACGNKWRQTHDVPKTDFIESQVKKNASHKNQPQDETSELSENIKKRLSSKNIKFAIATVILTFLFFLFLFLFRKDMVKMIPQTEYFYKQLGLDTQIAGISLQFPYLEKVNISETQTNLLIKGTILNTHPRDSLPIPPLKISLLDKTNLVIKTYYMTKYNTSILPPGGEEDFIYEIDNLPAKAVDTKLQFEEVK